MPVTHAALAIAKPKGETEHRSNKASFGTYCIAVALITGALTFYVYLRVSSLSFGYLLTQQRQQQLQLVQENRALKTEIGTLSSPRRIRSVAVEKLGMAPAEQFVELK